MSKDKQRKNEDDLTQQARQIDQHLQLIRQRLRQPLESAFAKGNVTAAQRTVMHALVSSEALSLKQLSRQVGLAHSTVSGIVDRLEARGMVERTVDPTDRRATLISPTRDVRNFIRDKVPALTTSPIVEALERATPAQRKTIRRGLQELRNLLEKNS